MYFIYPYPNSKNKEPFSLVCWGKYATKEMFLFSLQFSKRFYQKSRYYLFFTKFSSLVRKFSHGWMVKYLAFQLFFSTNIDLLILASFFRQWQTHKQYISMDFLVHVYKFFGMQLFPNVALLSANSCWRECVQRKYVGTWIFQEPRCVASAAHRTAAGKMWATALFWL